MRLREIRLANIPFLSYPSFANVDRFEHSLGVAHLAWRWARNNQLPEDQAIALALAGVYHDGAIPALGHLFEEYLFQFGWNHEKALEDLLVGRMLIPGREKAQVFVGESCQLEEVLARSPYRGAVTPMKVAELAVGKSGLGRVISSAIDLDNIDNVLRASSAMGLLDVRHSIHPYEVADALVWEDGEIRIRQEHSLMVAAWARARYTLYNEILNNPFEFRAQSALKWAIEVCAQSDATLRDPDAFLMTDPVLLFDHLRQQKFSRVLVDQVRKGSPPELLFSAWVDDLSPLVDQRAGTTMNRIRTQVEDGTGMRVYVNYYLDKRIRNIRMKLSQQPMLLPAGHFSWSDDTLVRTGPLPGILGIVGVTDAQYVGASANEGPGRQAQSRRKHFGVPEFTSVIESVLDQPVRAASRIWVGTKDVAEQFFLFAEC
jgi:hypothetical protein